MLADKEDPLQFELVKSFEEFKSSSKFNTYKGNILHVFTPEKEVVLINWLMSIVMSIVQAFVRIYLIIISFIG